MAIETEIKLHVADAESFLRQLEAFKPVLLSPRHFEDNYVLDFPNGEIRSKGCLLRVRIAENGALLTYKGAPLPEGPFKVREEVETRVENAWEVLEILNKLGMQVWFRYQKYRQEYAVALGERPGEEIHVAMDETPVGTYAELEGSEGSIRELAKRMGYKESQFLRDSYYSLYLRHCREKGVKRNQMLF